MYRNGTITLRFGSSEAGSLASKRLYAFVILWFFVLAQNSDLSSSRLLWWGSVALFVAVYMLSYGFQVYFDNYALWLFVFTAFAASSALWAITPSLVFDMLKTLAIHMMIFLLLYSSIRTQKDIDFLLKLLLMACVVNAIYLLFTNAEILDQSQEIADRLGSQEGWNANSIGMMTSVGALLSVYFSQKASKLSPKLLLGLIVVFLGAVSLITGSRKAVVMLMGGISAYVFLSAKGKRVRSLFFIVFFVLLIWYLIMENPYFYSVVGWRVEAFLSQFTGEGELDGSTLARQTLVEAAVDAWKQSPFLGHGLDCFRYFGELATGHDYYAHNNYVELLADLGVFGFLAYYGGYAYALIRSWKSRKNKLSMLLFVLVSIMVVIEYACVTYMDFLFGTIIMLAFANSKVQISEGIEE